LFFIAFPPIPNTLYRHFALISVLRQYVWSSKAWALELQTSKLVFSYSKYMPYMANFKPKRTAAASRGFLSAARLSCFVGWRILAIY